MKINTKPRAICFIDTAGGNHFVGKVEGDILFFGGVQIQARLEPMLKLTRPLNDSINPSGDIIANVYHQCIIRVSNYRSINSKDDGGTQKFEALEGDIGGTAFTGIITFSYLKNDQRKVSVLERLTAIPV